ncbi:MAG: hypothetical protein FWG58_03510 [Methanomassiliicoccaceae archaeon]|nr:hypothetical protein [Methanomassiliicoccaceae archaeon]
MRIIHAVPDEEDVERVKQAFEDLSNSDEETNKKFWTRVGLFDENGNVAEPFRDLFTETD